jgi:hypothetical protein
VQLVLLLLASSPGHATSAQPYSVQLLLPPHCWNSPTMLSQVLGLRSEEGAAEKQ